MGTLPPIQEANLGIPDSLFLMVLALVVFGPRRLPQIGRQIGKLMYEFRKASNDFKFQMEEELRNAEEADRRKREEEERQRKLALTAQTQPDAAGSETSQPGSTPPQADGQTLQSEPSADAAGSSQKIYPYGMQPAAPAETQADPPYPRIMPPSTGQTIAAGRAGGSASASDNEIVPAAVVGKIPPENEPSLDESETVTEQATHNG